MGVDDVLLTRECDYAVRLVRALADSKKKTVQAICEQEHIPTQYAYKILKKLENAGLVKSRRGPDGGYYLHKPPSSVTLLDIVTSIDSNLLLNECLKANKECSRNTEDLPCSVHKELTRIQSVLVDELGRHNMEDLLG